MKIDFLEMSNSIFYPLKTWAEKSTGNWNILIGGSFLLLVAGVLLLIVFRKKIGKSDERTSQIYLKSSYIMLSVIVLCDVIFPKEYMWQTFFLLKYSLAFVASAIYLIVRYKKDF